MTGAGRQLPRPIRPRGLANTRAHLYVDARHAGDTHDGGPGLIAHHVFDKEVDALQSAWICVLPVEIFLPRLGREDEIHASNFNFFRKPLPPSSDSIDFNSRLAFAGERNR